MATKIGIMHSGSNNGKHDDHIQAFKDGLKWAGGANATILGPHYADDNPANLDSIAHNFVTTDKVDVLVAAGGSRSADAAKKATDPKAGLSVVFTSVADSTRPADNITGICARTTALDVDRLKYLSQLLPGKTNFGALLNKQRPDHDSQKSTLESAATILDLNLVFEDIDPSGATPVDTQIDSVFQSWNSNSFDGALVTADPLFNNHRDKVIKAAKTHTIPAIYQWREFAEDGGLMSYGPNLTVAYLLAGTYVGKILSGMTPKMLAVLPLNNFELVINLKTAQHDLNNLNIPATLLASADDIIV